ncbi:hypothetical protein SDC9_159716 [bioreactor metagenome]|uniref:Uncharacterized protein n=1 Tax=bioreactor metagenome TaxID=1076179 RepID=A0A645FDB2_9ZZZZ
MERRDELHSSLQLPAGARAAGTAGYELAARAFPPDSSGERGSERGDGDLVAERCAQAAQPSDLRAVPPVVGRAEAFPAQAGHGTEPEICRSYAAILQGE